MFTALFLSVVLFVVFGPAVSLFEEAREWFLAELCATLAILGLVGFFGSCIWIGVAVINGG